MCWKAGNQNQNQNHQIRIFFWFLSPSHILHFNTVYRQVFCRTPFLNIQSEGSRYSQEKLTEFCAQLISHKNFSNTSFFWTLTEIEKRLKLLLKKSFIINLYTSNSNKTSSSLDFNFHRWSNTRFPANFFLAASESSFLTLRFTTSWFQKDTVLLVQI